MLAQSVVGKQATSSTFADSVTGWAPSSELLRGNSPNRLRHGPFSGSEFGTTRGRWLYFLIRLGPSRQNGHNG